MQEKCDLLVVPYTVLILHDVFLRALHRSILEPIAEPRQTIHRPIIAWNPRDNFYDSSMNFFSLINVFILQ